MPGGIPGYDQYPSSNPNPVTLTPYDWAGNDSFINPSFGVDSSGLSIKNDLRPPSIWDSIKEGLYRGLMGTGGSSNPFGRNPFGFGPNDPLSPRMAGQDPRAFEAIPDILKYDVQRLLSPRLNPRGGSIYSGFMR